MDVFIFDESLFGGDPGDYSVGVSVLGDAGPVSNKFLLLGIATSLSAETVWFEFVDQFGEIDFADPGTPVPAPPTLLLLALGLLGLGVKRMTAQTTAACT